MTNPSLPAGDTPTNWQDWKELLESSQASLEEAIEQRDEARRREAQLRQWVNDLQSRMYVNCVYCGHRYGPKSDTPVSMADVLKEHIEQCPDHPMSTLKARVRELEAALEIYKEPNDTSVTHSPQPFDVEGLKRDP